MVPNHRRNRSMVLDLDRPDPLLSPDRMHLDDLKLVRRKRPGLLDDLLWHSELPDVMYQAAELYELAFVHRKPHALGYVACVGGNHDGVVGRVGVVLLMYLDETRHEAGVRCAQK